MQLTDFIFSALIILEFIDLSYITVEYFLRLFTAPKIKKHLKGNISSITPK